MRSLHAPVAGEVYPALKAILDEGRPADKVLQSALRSHRKWGSQDRRLFAELVYDLVRNWRKFGWCIGTEWPKTDQVFHPTIDTVDRFIKIWALAQPVDLSRSGLKVEERDQMAAQKWGRVAENGADEFSLPNSMYEWVKEELGQRTIVTLRVLHQMAPVFLRVNRLKTNAGNLMQSLTREGYRIEQVDDDTFRLVERANVFRSKAFSEGYFEVQDRNSQEVAKALKVESGHRVIDACAGAGGKTLHLASLMRDRGKVIALDVSLRKLEELKVRARRSGASCIETRLIESTKTIKRLAKTADRLLLDVPCSGLGVLRRNPDAKWHWTRQELDRLRALQSEILARYTPMVKPEGLIVYSTCSIVPSENRQQVDAFLKAAEGRFELVQDRTLWPEPNGGDGFYIAEIKRLG